MYITTTKGKRGHTLEREQGGVFGDVLREERGKVGKDVITL